MGGEEHEYDIWERVISDLFAGLAQLCDFNGGRFGTGYYEWR